jgi:hypothetical protein
MQAFHQDMCVMRMLVFGYVCGVLCAAQAAIVLAVTQLVKRATVLADDKKQTTT